MAAINTEAGAIMSEIMRLYSTAEYNQVSLFNREAYQLSPEHQALTEELNKDVRAKAEYNGFIEDPKTYTDEEVAAMARVKDVSSFTSGEKYAIYTKEELEKLRDYVNAGNNTASVEFVLGADIDLSSISNWTPIGQGTDSESFRGNFDGNGHVISNLTIDSNSEQIGLFGYILASDGDITIKNIALKNVNIKGSHFTGGLVGQACEMGAPFEISNCYVTGTVSGIGECTGGLIGQAYATIKSCYADVSVTGIDYVGGLIGLAYTVSDCYATGNVNGNDYTGGLIGYADMSSNTNIYATGNVNGNDYTGGLVGYANMSSNTNIYATGNVSGNDYVGGLTGYGIETKIHNSYTSGNISGVDCVGGIQGWGEDSNFIDTSSYSQVTGNSKVGAIVGHVDSYGYFNLNKVSAIKSTTPIIGCYCDVYAGVEDHAKAQEYEELVTRIQAKPVSTTLQVGINSDTSCQIAFDTNFKFDLSAIEGNIANDEALAAINDFTNLLSEKSTQLGAVQNRLDSAIESISVNMENLTSSLSTIRDADIAEVSLEAQTTIQKTLKSFSTSKSNFPISVLEEIACCSLKSGYE